MTRRRITARVPLMAVSAVALLVGSLTSTNSLAAASAPRASQLAQAIAVPSHGLNPAAGAISAKPRALGGQATGGDAGPGRSTGVPASGTYTFLLELNAPSTLTAYRGAAARGEAAAASAAKTQFAQVRALQAAVTAALPRGSKVLYRTHSALAAVAVTADVNDLAALKGITGVRAVYPVSPKTASNAYAVPLQGAPQAWTAHGDLGQNATIAVIDTGIDYTHAMFGGPGTVAAYQKALATDTLAADPALFPSTKIIAGYDLVGDDYDGADPASVPVPDPNPLDCEGHGSHVAGSAAGLGVTAAGGTFHGPYNSSTDFGALRIGPGMAPAAKIVAYKVFGCKGSSNVVGEAIDRATDPNGDGDPSDHASVINMSLSSDFGSPQDGDSMMSNAAFDLGVSVVAAAGNGGDYYDVGGSPGDAVGAIAVANSVDASSVLDGLTVSAPAGIARTFGAERSVDFDYSKGDLAGTVTALPEAYDGCYPLNADDRYRVKGKIAFLEWTEDVSMRACDADVRAAHVQAAGGIGFILADDSESFAAPIGGSALIPGVLLVKSASDAMRQHLREGVTISGTVPNAVQKLFPQNNDKLFDSSSRGIHDAGNVKPDVTAVGTSVFSTAMGTGNQGRSMTGTSAATPMVAGLSALIRSMHPDWTAQETKADIMNTAGQDLYTGDNHTGARYAPNRVGAGRIQADAALDNSVLAMVKDDPGAVSASFGPVQVTGPTTLVKTIKVVNKGLNAVSYKLAYEALTSVPGVSYRLSAPTMSVDGLSTRTFTVSFVVTDATELTKTADPTVAVIQSNVPRDFVADASGRIVLTPTTGTKPSLRVPVYSAPRPASVMTQAASVTMPSGAIQQAALPLTGKPVQQGTGATLVQSTVAGFELQAVSGLAPTCSTAVTTECVAFADERAADLKYVGATSNAPQINSIPRNARLNANIFFAITTQGAWRTPVSPQEFDVLIDTTGDLVPDVVLTTIRFHDQDVFDTAAYDLHSGLLLGWETIDAHDGDNALFDSDTMVLPLAMDIIPNLPLNSRIRYGVRSYFALTGRLIDSIGVGADGNLSKPLSINPFQPGIVVYGKFVSNHGSGGQPGNLGLLYVDAPGTMLQVRRDAQRYPLDGGLGVLMVHFHNKVGSKAQVVALKSTPPPKPSS